MIIKREGKSQLPEKETYESQVMFFVRKKDNAFLDLLENHVMNLFVFRDVSEILENEKREQHAEESGEEII